MQQHPGNLTRLEDSLIRLSGNSWEFHSSETSVPGVRSRPGNCPWPIFRPTNMSNSPSVPKDSPLACFKNFFQTIGPQIRCRSSANIPLTTKTAGLNLSGSNQQSCRTTTEMPRGLKPRLPGLRSKPATPPSHPLNRPTLLK